jgi:predicted DsbA family dithiol-disulfide isomerase
MQTLQKKYGKRLAGIFRPLIKKGTNDSILRLFHIARKENKEALAIESFYHAKFKENLDLSEPEVIVNIAEKLGLTNEYHKMRDSTWVDRAINFDVLLASNYKIYSTPTWIIEKQLKIKTNFNNLEVVINSLLLK